MAQIFDQDGEEGFRDVEAAVLNEVASYARVVVSTGGGVVSRPQNWGHLRNGIVVYLQAPVGCASFVDTAPKWHAIIRCPFQLTPAPSQAAGRPRGS